MNNRPRLLFVSTRFLFPADTGGQIRTVQVLRGMKGGKFEITLASPVPGNAEIKYKSEIETVSDRFISWPEKRRSAISKLIRMRYLFSALPIPVITDWSRVAQRIVEKEFIERHDIVVFDFPHAAVLAPKTIPIPSVMFTHNVEAEILLRHRNVVADPVRRYIWSNQYRKMTAYERSTLSRFDTIVAVSERDKEAFLKEYRVNNVSIIRTGVDLEYFEYSTPGNKKNIVFTGSMDWMANIDGIEYFLEHVWPLIASKEKEATMTVVGRNPPNHLIAQAKGKPWEFTGFVDDVRPFMKRSGVYVIPLRVGGGTRLKVFEAMASGCPVVSTAIGVEGLPLIGGEHYLLADSANEMADAILKLMRNSDLRNRLSRNARKYVEENFSFTQAAREFEEICTETLGRAVSS